MMGPSKRMSDENTAENIPPEDVKRQRPHSATTKGGKGPSVTMSSTPDSQGSFEAELMDMQDHEELEFLSEQQNAEGIEAPVPTAAMKWRRPPAREVKSKEDDIAFQWLDIDMYSGKPLPSNPKEGAPLCGGRFEPVPIIRVYGVNEQGNSVLAHIHGFTPYFYCHCPSNFDEQEHLEPLRDALNQALRNQGGVKTEGAHVHAIEVETKQTIYGYHFDEKRKFLKIYLILPNFVPKARSMIERGALQVPGFGSFRSSTFESNVAFVLRFMIDRDITGANWLELPKGTYSVRSEDRKIGRAQIEVDIVFDNVISHPATGKWSKVAPFRILSFDIECMGRKGVFPEPEQDPVIQIANVVMCQGEATPSIRNVFVLDRCNPIVGAQVLWFEKETELLDKWASFLREADPDIITGYNVMNFDIPYLLKRAERLKIQNTFWKWGRIKNSMCYMQSTTFSSSAYGKSENIQTTIDGRVVFDMLQYMTRNHKLSSYSLNAVSANFLGQQKEDVHHSIISDLQRGSDEDRRRLAVYCLKDAWLPLRLMDKLLVMYNYIEMARVTGVPLDFLLTRGQQIKVLSMLLRKCREEGLLIPVLPRDTVDQGYEGATVIEPKKGFYKEPIATLDFASLYPSIMQAYNLCYSTLLAKEDVDKLQPHQYQKSPSGDYFVKASTKKGVLPIILEELLSARKRAKKDMAAATDPMEKAVQNGRQLALKISANSVYGFTGATVGQLPCVQIASSVTAYGRDLLFQTRNEIERIYTVENGYPANATVVYGDTDSVMVNFGISDLKKAMPLAEQAAEKVTSIFPSPIKLEFEKVYYPFLLMNKKRYAGLLWTNPDKHDKMDTKGLETVRRDNCLLVRQVVDTCLKKILIDKDVDGAIQYTKGVISDLLQNRLDISLLVITKALGKSADSEDYSAKQAHVELAARMKARDAGSAPNVGDRVAYVIIEKSKGTPAYEKSEDPIYALENNLPIDCNYYLHNQLEKPLMRIFSPIISNPNSLLHGEHTLKRKKLAVASGGIMRFAKKTLTCMSCKSPLYGGRKTLCKHCEVREAEIYLERLQISQKFEVDYSRLWTQCQRCQASFHQDVLCTSRDCPIFYKRVKARKDLDEAQKDMERFNW